MPILPFKTPEEIMAEREKEKEKEMKRIKRLVKARALKYD
jgi:hypothetical protein